MNRALTIVKGNFSGSQVNNLIDELRTVVFKTEYANVTICEIIGILEMLKIEMLERTSSA